MLTLRCTNSLMRYIEVSPDAETEGRPEGALGAWYANNETDVGTVILAVNEHTRYTIPIFPDPRDEDGPSNYMNLYVRLIWRIHEALRRLGLDEQTAQRVTDEHRGGVVIAPTASRSVLGTVNQMARQLVYHVSDAAANHDPSILESLEERLNETPILPMNGAAPIEMLIERCRQGERT